jgi:CHASE2 domain-containing sensor protein
MNPQEWATIVGVFMPLVISLVKRPGWPEWGGILTAALVSLVVGTVTTAVTEGLAYGDIDTVFTSMAACLGAATFVYKTWFKYVPMAAKLDEKLTRLALLPGLLTGD